MYRWLHEKLPDIELSVFSSYKIYNQTQDFEPLKREIESLPNTRIQESILQRDLAKEFLKSKVLFYPCHFEETSCITAIEAMAAGCVPLIVATFSARQVISTAIPAIFSRAGGLLPACRR